MLVRVRWIENIGTTFILLGVVSDTDIQILKGELFNYVSCGLPSVILALGYLEARL